MLKPGGMSKQRACHGFHHECPRTSQAPNRHPSYHDPILAVSELVGDSGLIGPAHSKLKHCSKVCKCSLGSENGISDCPNESIMSCPMDVATLPFLTTSMFTTQRESLQLANKKITYAIERRPTSRRPHSRCARPSILEVL